ncbi:MAG: hypothetical protein ACI9O3_000566 [Colwellia sp.]|jgi:hypothetical protein
MVKLSFNNKKTLGLVQSEGLLYLLFNNFSYTQHQLRNGLMTTTTERSVMSKNVKFIVN